MFSSWTDRQGQVGDLRNKSKEELEELLLRQEKILTNRRLLQTLPDKGKRIKDFADKVRLAIEHHNEEEKRRSLVSDTRTELQSRYQQAFTIQQGASSDINEAAAGPPVQERAHSPVSADVQEKTCLDKRQDGSVIETMETAASAGANPLNSSGLVEALERVTVSETRTGLSSQSKDSLNSRETDNYFFRKHLPKKPHYVEILEKTETSSTPRKQKFKPNQLAHRNNISPSGSSSPAQSSEGSSPLSAQDRRERDRKHLDDITAAKLPPLYHSQAQLLSVEESAILMREQTKKQQELQAKLAAQKLSEGLKVSMGSYTPDGGPMAAYREVHHEGAQLSSEED